MFEFLSNGVWQGIGAIAGIISVFISLWQARKSQPANSKGSPTGSSTAKRILLAFFSLLMPTYAIFVGSILLVNAFTTDPYQITYGSVALTAVLGLLWGIVWANYIQKVFKSTPNRRLTSKQKSNGA